MPEIMPSSRCAYLYQMHREKCCKHAWKQGKHCYSTSNKLGSSTYSTQSLQMPARTAAGSRLCAPSADVKTLSDDHFLRKCSDLFMWHVQGRLGPQGKMQLAQAFIQAVCGACEWSPHGGLRKNICLTCRYPAPEPDARSSVRKRSG